jgi:thiol:disulfide interchange protein
MRRLVCVLALAAAGLIACGAQASAAEITWASSFDEAFKAAKEKNLPIMIDVYTDWCGWCKKLDKDVYTADNVVQLSQKFVCLKLNPEKDKEHGELFKVEGYPTIVFTDVNRKELHRIDGYLAANEFAAEMRKALDAFSGKK